MPKVLVVDDDREICRAIGLLLKDEDIDSVFAHNGADALTVLEQESLDCVVLDIMMPKMDGLRATLKIREASEASPNSCKSSNMKSVPILLLSAKSEQTDKILGLELGADDYITKPFDPAELMARIKAAIRRFSGGFSNRPTTESMLTIGGLCYDTAGRSCTVDGEPIRLTPTECKILELLMREPGRVFPAEEIYNRVWQTDAFGSENTVMVHIRRIREKIEHNPRDPQYLKVVWGIGYKISS